MKICQYLDTGMIFPDLTAGDKEGLLAELAEGIARLLADDTTPRDTALAGREPGLTPARATP